MAQVADRYLRTGQGVIPMIYPSSVAAMTAAMKDAHAASYRYCGEHFIEGVYTGERLVLRVYENGECTYPPARP
jgi:hypothetical protein